MIRIVSDLLKSGKLTCVIKLSKNLYVYLQVIIVVHVLNILQSEKLFMEKFINHILPKIMGDSQFVVVEDLVPLSSLLFALTIFTGECSCDNISCSVKVIQLLESCLVGAFGVVTPLWWRVKYVKHLIVKSRSCSPATLFSSVDPELLVWVTDFVELFLGQFDPTLIWIGDWCQICGIRILENVTPDTASVH